MRLCMCYAQRYLDLSLIYDAASECVYQPKNKPGLKPGAVEALTRRVGTLIPCLNGLHLTKNSLFRKDPLGRQW